MQEALLDARDRSDLYALAARIFEREVDVELYRKLTSPAIEGLCRPGGLALIEPEIRALGDSRAVEELAVEYCRLFVGPQPLCPPYASAWRGEALLGGRARTELEEFLRRHSIEVETEAGRIASCDHVAVHLAVVAHLNGREAPAPVIREFAQHHLLPWAFEWVDATRTATRRSLYRTAADLVATMLETTP